VYDSISFKFAEVRMILRNACPRCGCDLQKKEDEFGEYVFCTNLYWIQERAVRGCMWLGSPKEFMLEDRDYF
jgi:hypothetical protein